jgi:hypothetical protein
MEPRQTLEPFPPMDPLRPKQRLVFESTNSLHNTLAPEAPANESATGFANDEYLVGIPVERSTETPRGLLIKKILPPEPKQFPVSDARRFSAPSRMETPTGVPTDTALLTDKAAYEFFKRGNSVLGSVPNRRNRADHLRFHPYSPYTVNPKEGVNTKEGDTDDVSMQVVKDGNTATPVNPTNGEANPIVQKTQSIQNIAQGNSTKPIILRPKKRKPGTVTSNGGYASRRSSRPGMGGAADAPRHQFTVRRR